MFVIMAKSKSMKDAHARILFLDNLLLIRGTAPQMWKEIIKVVARFGIPPESIVCVADDGTSVNCGELSGIKVLMREEWPWTVFFQDLAHKTPLHSETCLKNTHFTREYLARLHLSRRGYTVHLFSASPFAICK